MKEECCYNNPHLKRNDIQHIFIQVDMFMHLSTQIRKFTEQSVYRAIILKSLVASSTKFYQVELINGDDTYATILERILNLTVYNILV